MKKLDIFFLCWCSFFAVFELVLLFTLGVTFLRITCFILNVTVFTLVFIENKEYLMTKFKEHILKDLQ